MGFRRASLRDRALRGLDRHRDEGILISARMKLLSRECSFGLRHGDERLAVSHDVVAADIGFDELERVDRHQHLLRVSPFTPF